eukprot:2420522-Lingulodinium_polyedra.AAC.1
MVPKFNYSMPNKHPLRLASCHVPHIHCSWPRGQIPNISQLARSMKMRVSLNAHSTTDSPSTAPDEWIESRRGWLLARLSEG